MKKISSLLIFCLLTQSVCLSQAKMRKLSSSINHPSLNLYAPLISADGNSMIFISDNTEDQVLTPFFTSRDATDWKTPQMLPQALHTRLNFLRGFGLSPDGKRIFVSTLKGPGVGGYDMFYADLKGSTWGQPVNFGAPINSKQHEASPSFTVDGNTMYFMRCDAMDQQKATGCKILSVSKKSNGQWGEVTELPDYINTGNSQAPRIMADSETLIFSSDKIQPNKGGMDLYVTKFVNGKWSSPLPMDFVNTPGDDQYVSAVALGRYLLKDNFGGRKNEIVEYLIPDELRPKSMMRIEGKVSDPAISTYVAVVDLATNKLIYNGKANADGTFLVYLKEGSSYELSVEPEQGQMTYFSKVFDLTGDRIAQWEKVNATIKPLTAGDEISLSQVTFLPGTADLNTKSSANELKRLTRLLLANPDKKVELQVMLTGYEESEEKTSEDLSEVVVDSVMTKFDVTDSLGNISQMDSVIVKTVYHNNRTEAQGQTLLSFFEQQGLPKQRFKLLTNAIPATSEQEKKLVVKAVIR